MKFQTFLSVVGLAAVFMICSADSCNAPPTADSIQHDQQETILKEATREVGMPNITNFRERRLMKAIIEMRDDPKLITYTYYFNTMTGKIGDLVCQSIGYPLPGATQFTNPSAVIHVNNQGGGWLNEILPQADPNGLFSPAAEDATWVMCKDPNSDNVAPMYVEPQVITSQWKLK